VSRKLPVSGSNPKKSDGARIDAEHGASSELLRKDDQMLSTAEVRLHGRRQRHADVSLRIRNKDLRQGELTFDG
jgi:hypothetical protein